MSDTTPALTAEDWENVPDVIDGLVAIDLGIIDVRLGGPAGARDTAKERLLLAGLLLHGQPFGFTWADVDLIRHVFGDGPAHMLSIADRIAALLPPRYP